MKEIRLARKILTTLVKDRLQYPGRLIVDTMGLLARCGILLILYWYVYRLRGGTINGTTFLFAAWSIFFYFAFSIMRFRDIAWSIMQDVKSGNVEVLLNKPISYLSYRMWWQVGSGLYSFVVITVLATVALAYAIGLPPTMTTAVFLPTLLLAFLGGALLSLFLYTVVGLLSFWIEDIGPVFWVVDKTVMMLGGSYLPVALFPPIMYKIALYSPFGASQFVTHTVSASWQTNWPQLIGIQLFWVVTFGLLAYFVFEGAKKKVSVNGG
jgi:ABC-2 type transport system permease protein